MSFCVKSRKNCQAAHNNGMNRKIPVLAAMALILALFVALVDNYFLNNDAVTTFADGQKIIYLTFDDGPSDRVTPKILDVLKKENVPATFFVVGVQAEKRRDVLKRIYDEGHSIGVHSYSHRYNEIYSSASVLLKDIEKCNEVICSVTGSFTDLYRFPGGSFSVAPELKEAVKSQGYRCVDWNASFRDSELRDMTAGKLYTAALNTVSNPDRIVMLAHDTTDKSATVEALKEVIRHFKKQGYKFGKL